MDSCASWNRYISKIKKWKLNKDSSLQLFFRTQGMCSIRLFDSLRSHQVSAAHTPRDASPYMETFYRRWQFR